MPVRLLTSAVLLLLTLQRRSLISEMLKALQRWRSRTAPKYLPYWQCPKNQMNEAACTPTCTRGKPDATIEPHGSELDSFNAKPGSYQIKIC